MTRRLRRNHTPAFKVKVALAATADSGQTSTQDSPSEWRNDGSQVKCHTILRHMLINPCHYSGKPRGHASTPGRCLSTTHEARSNNIRVAE